MSSHVNLKHKEKPVLKPRPKRKFMALNFTSTMPKKSLGTLARLKALLDPYTHLQVIEDSYTLGALVPDLDMLAADINETWNLQPPVDFYPGELEKGWTVFFTASYIDLKLKAQKKQGGGQ